jgi:hypothetical protein
MLLLLLMQAGLLSSAAGAEPASECVARGNAVLNLLEAANHCAAAADCAVLTASCGTAVNRKELSKVQSAQNEFFSRCGKPELRCAHWTKLVCEQKKCVTR